MVTAIVLISIENVHGSEYGDLLIGTSARNGLSGGGGNDTFAGGGGGDIIDGGAGIDTVTYASFGGAVASSRSLQASTGDFIIGVENVIGSAFSDALTGDGNANRLEGGQGNDLLEGRAGSDTLDGGTGEDTASYATSSAGVAVDLNVSGPQGGSGDGAGEILIGIEHLIGSNFGDYLVGDAFGNVLQGLAGDDFINGSVGADVMAGGVGNDFYVADTAGDVVQEFVGQRLDTILTSVNYALQEGHESRSS